jgi:hypothetical protein
VYPASLEASMFFFEKRTKKLLIIGLRRCSGTRANFQKFLPLFFKKEVLAFSPVLLAPRADIK